MRLISYVAAVMISVVGAAQAQDVWITPEIPFVEVETKDGFIAIERVQDNNAVASGEFIKTSRACPPFCIQPMEVADGVRTVGELEVLQFMKGAAANGNAFWVDSRTPDYFNAGTIPGSLNLPYNMFTPIASNPFMAQILTLLGGVEQSNGDWDLSGVPTLLLYCNGPWCDQSPMAINNLIAVGYPQEKLFYYRGGMQNWVLMGLTVTVP